MHGFILATESGSGVVVFLRCAMVRAVEWCYGFNARIAVLFLEFQLDLHLSYNNNSKKGEASCTLQSCTAQAAPFSFISMASL